MRSPLLPALTVTQARWRSAYSPIWGVMAIALVLRIFQLGSEGLWVDETYSLEDASELTLLGNTRPLYYILLHLWMQVSDSILWLRGLSVLLDLGAIWLAYGLCRQVLGQRVAWITALLMALSPLLINHAQEIRMYPLITCLTLAGSWALAQALTQPTPGRLALWAVARLLALLTSPLMLMLALPDCLLYGYTYWGQWRHLRRFGYSVAFIAAVWLPLVFQKFLVAQAAFTRTQGDWRIAIDSGGLVSLLSRLTSLTVFWPLRGLQLAPNALPLRYYQGMTLLLVLVLVVALVQLWRHRNAGLVWIAIWGGVPTAIQFLASTTVMSGTLWRARYLLYVSPFILMLLAYGFEQIRRWRPKLALLVALLYGVGVAGGLGVYYTATYRPAWQAVADVIEAREQVGDVVLNYTLMGRHTFPRYFEGEAELFTIHLPRNLGPAEQQQQVQSAIATLPTAERLWMVCQEGCRADPAFDRITTAVTGPDPDVLTSQSFTTLGSIIENIGALEVHLVQRTSGSRE